MKVCCVSDLHGNLVSVPDCDVLVVAGDIVPTWAHDPYQGKGWLDYDFRRWLEGLSRRMAVVGIAGNHDFACESYDDLGYNLPWIYLKDEGVEIDGVRFYGSPYTPYFGGWAFNLYEEELEAKWQSIPLDTDVLVTHGPPYGVGDRTREGEHVGSPSLRRAIQDVYPRLVVCGHIHEGYGKYKLGETLVVNAAQVDENYLLTRIPVVVEI